jgi:DNA-binding IclR family transcriptional regulator
MTNSRQFVESLNRGLKLLKRVSESTSPMSLSELASMDGLSISTIQRLTYTLHQLGLLDRDPRTKKFKIGPEMITMSFSVINKLTLTKVAYPHMLHLRNQINEVVCLGVLSGGEVVFIETMKTQRLLNINTDRGVRMSIHNTSTGKVLLAFLPDSEMSTVLDEISFEKVTKNTITTAIELKALFPKIREQGFATAIDESVTGLGAVSAVIRGNDGLVRGALTILVPTARVSGHELVNKYSKKVMETADRISIDLGYRENAAAE